MPVYEYQCKGCVEDWESFHSVDTRLEENCAYCNEKATLLISNTARPIINEYYSESLDATVTGPKQRKRLMKQKGMEEV